MRAFKSCIQPPEFEHRCYPRRSKVMEQMGIFTVIRRRSLDAKIAGTASLYVARSLE